VAAEIERKFLVADRDVVAGRTGQRLVQGYLAIGATTVRVRIAGASAWLTIKGPAQRSARAEFEYPIPVADANAMLTLCIAPPIEKVRFPIHHGEHVWEVDVFEGANAPLIVAEVELDAADEVVQLPAWVGREVTDDPRYLNARLAEHPFGSWETATKNP